MDMKLFDAIENRRSIRKFQQKPISVATLTALVDAARIAPYPANIQPLQFAIIHDPAMLYEVFTCTRWAGYLDHGAPKPNERPMAYIAILGDSRLKKNRDFQVETGIAGMTITLAAMEYGLASCWLGALDREQLTALFHLPAHLCMLDIIALGYPAQESRMVPMQDGDVRYYLDENGVLEVPKRSLDDIIYNI